MSEFVEFPKRMYKERKYVLGETAVDVNNAEELKKLGPGWFDSPAKCPDREAERAEIQRRYWERFEAADGNPNGQALILIEYRSQHPKEAAADSWYKEVAPLIPLLQSQAQSQAILNLAADRKAEDRERRTTEAEATARLAAAPAQPSSPAIVVSGDDKKKRRAAIDAFIAKVTDAKRKITRKDISTVAGYRTTTDFERFQRCDRRSTKNAEDNFTRVLNMNPDDFIQSLESKPEEK